MPTRTARLDQAPTSTWTPTIKPDWFSGRREVWLGKAVGINQFGVNHLVLAPGAYSSLRHWHEQEDEFAYVLSGEVTLIDDHGEHLLRAGDCAGFPAGETNAHHLVNRSGAEAVLLVVGSRHRGTETLHYPDEADPGPFEVTRNARGDRV